MAQTAGVAAHSLPTFVPVQHQRRHPSKHRLFFLELSQALFDFVVQLLPTAEELAVKEDVRKLLERLIRTIQPESRLLSFGSTANGFSLRNSDMDLCCLIDSDERLSASDLVVVLGDLLERETKFHVKPLPHARIPIVKLSLDPSPGLPSGIACDIGFENRLALENTRLLMCYAMIDPTRIRTLVLFLKVWSKRRKINSPYHGTLSSYGYVLLVLYFLIHVKNPPVLPNLQQIPPLRPISKDAHINGHNTWFFDDIELLCQRWRSSNTETVAELLIDFFRYYARDFSYNTGVASIRAGLLKKESKGWQNDLSNSKYNDSRERNRFCIEDPFEIDFNVARCVTKEGLYQIRGEFMRASRILAMRPRALAALTQLCEEKVGEPLAVPTSSIFIPPRLSVPLQATNSVGNSPTRSKVSSPSGRLSLRPEFFEHAKETLAAEQCTSTPPLPEHMAPKRSQWTSPPPPEAPPAQHAMFEDQLDQGLALATSSSDARENSVSTRSRDSAETTSDEERRSVMTESDDVTLVSGNPDTLDAHCPLPASPIPLGLEPRGTPPACPVVTTDDHTVQSPLPQDAKLSEQKLEPLRRSHSGPPNLKANRFSWPSTSTTIYPSLRASAHVHISHHHPHLIPGFDPSTVFYETGASHTRFPHITHLQPRQHSVGAYPLTSSCHHLSSGPRLDRHSQQPTRCLHEQRECGTNILEHELSAIRLSGAGHSDVNTEHGRTGDGKIERSPSQTNPSPPTYTPRRHPQTLPIAIVAHTPMCNAATSPDSRSTPLAPIAQRHVGASSRSTSHSPLRASIHHRSATAASPATTPVSPSLHLPSDPTSPEGDGSTPPLTSLPPSPPLTTFSSHPPRSHEESLRYSSPLSQTET
ncbi:hypothetical protein SCLCIDRAFT_16840 [Scleroderma citrinum Foug A]|uniref:polynucleotide adenylyltransferase n=1 Tax=Scleroderma citrinum Foug A TaxID=1036808 RepID=A0A0C2Z7X4_9AGAM|nr:hypothetical protein SCLCIDRAFT_16840 [Scleroderma citrinum Foug A]